MTLVYARQSTDTGHFPSSFIGARITALAVFHIDLMQSLPAYLGCCCVQGEERKEDAQRPAGAAAAHFCRAEALV